MRLGHPIVRPGGDHAAGAPPPPPGGEGGPAPASGAAAPAHGAAAPSPPHSEARILSILSQFAGMQLVLACTGLVRNKVVALRLGPDGYGEITQIAAVTAVGTTLVAFGMGVSLSRNAAKARSLAERQTLLANANGIVLGLGGLVVAGALSLLATGRLLPLAALTESPAMLVAVALFVAAVPIEGLKTNYLALLQGILDVRGLAIRRSVGVLAATAVAVPVVWFFGFVGAAIQFFLLSVMVAVLLGRRCRALGYSPLALRLERGRMVHLASFGVVSMASGFAQALSETAVRTRLIDAAGAAANGLLQAPLSLSTTVKGIVLASIGSVSLATIAASSDRAEISRAVERLLNVVVPLGALSLGLLGLVGVPSLSVLYSSAFTSGAELFPWILTADLLMVFVWVVGAPLLALGDRVLWLALDLLYAAGRWGFAVLLIPHVGTTAVVAGYLAAVALHLALNLAVYRARHRLRLAPRHLGRLLAGAALVALLSLAGAFRTGSPATIVVAIAAWGAYALHQGRRSGALSAIRRRLGSA